MAPTQMTLVLIVCALVIVHACSTGGRSTCRATAASDTNNGQCRLQKSLPEELERGAGECGAAAGRRRRGRPRPKAPHPGLWPDQEGAQLPVPVKAFLALPTMRPDAMAQNHGSSMRRCRILASPIDANKVHVPCAAPMMIRPCREQLRL